MINNNIGDVRKTFFLQLYSQVFQTKIFGENTKKKNNLT